MKIGLPLKILFLIYIALSILFYFLQVRLSFGIPFEQTSVILTGAFLISIIILLVFARGARLGGKSWLTHTLAAISLKFILYLILIILVFFLSKNRSLEFILTFFVIYLSFTSYLLVSFFNILKTKNIKK
jgi:hypothetical protein